MSKILILAATGVAGLVLGAGIGVAAAGQGTDPATRDWSADIASMDEMHAAMLDQMPAELVEQCDQMHAAMGEHMADGDHAQMTGPVGSMMSGLGDHAEHHRGSRG